MYLVFLGLIEIVCIKFVLNKPQSITFHINHSTIGTNLPQPSSSKTNPFFSPFNKSNRKLFTTTTLRFMMSTFAITSSRRRQDRSNTYFKLPARMIHRRFWLMSHRALQSYNFYGNFSGITNQKTLISTVVMVIKTGPEQEYSKKFLLGRDQRGGTWPNCVIQTLQNLRLINNSATGMRL